MIFVLFFSLSGAKVQFIVIVDNLTPKKTKKNCFTTQNLFFGRSLEKKKSVVNTTNGIMNIPRKKLATCLVKCKERELWTGAFLQSDCIRFKPQKCVSDRRKELHFCHPNFRVRRLLSGGCGNLSDCEKILCIQSFPCEISSTAKNNPFGLMRN